MDASEAKKRVREKYPEARCEECSSYTVGTVGVWYVWAKLYAPIGAGVTEELAWLSAYQNLKGK